MLRLQLYILRRLAASLVLVVIVVSTILFVGQTVRLLDRMRDVGVEFLLGLLPLFLPVTLALTLPMAFLLTAVLTYGRLAEDNEVLAMRMAGIHPWAIVVPGVFAGAVVSFACLWLQGTLAPAALAGQDAVRRDVCGLFVEIVERGEKSTFANGDFRISWEGVEGGELTDLRISRGGSGSSGSQEVHARRAALRRDASGGTLVFRLQDFLMVTTDPDGSARTFRGEETTYAVPTAELLSVRGTVAKVHALRYDELLFRMFTLAPGGDRRIEIEREAFGRIAIALAPLGFALCGIPLALLWGKRSRSAATVLAFGVAVLFFVLWQAGNSLAASHRLPAAPAMLGGNVVLLGLGALLLRKAVRR